ncbi:MAG: methionine--tRNA ligase subunit beta, partial [Myxococcota bacterium]
CWGEFQPNNNSELAQNFGNFVNRTVKFVKKYGEATVPAAPATGERPEIDALWDEVRTHANELGTAIEEYRMREAVQSLMAIGRAGNKFFNDAEPWRTRREDEAHCAGTLHTCLQLCASLSVFAAPFLPFTAERLQKMLRLEGVQGSGPDAPAGTIGWNDAKQPLLKAGHALGEAEILVSKVPDEAVKAQRDKLEAAAEAAAAEEAEYAKAKETIVFDDFVKLDLRVGKVLSAERVKKSKKLIKCIVDIGFEERQILAGVADQMSAEDLEGAQVIVVANLPPRKMAGLESQGMLLMAENREGKLVRVQADSEPGSTVS